MRSEETFFLYYLRNDLQNYFNILEGYLKNPHFE